MSSALIITGDVRAVLPTLEAASFDLAIADPAYGETSLKWDKRVAGWPALVRPLLKPHGSLWCFGSLRSLLETHEDFDGWKLAQDLVWEKQNGSGFSSAAGRFVRVHEIAAHYYPADIEWGEVYQDPQKVPGKARPGARIRARGKTPHQGAIGVVGYDYTDERFARSVIFEPNCHGRAIHPTEKPLGIQQTIVRYSCPPGGNVLALFAGSGSTLVAARREGRDSLGIEIDPGMADKARTRLAEDEPLFNRAVGGTP